MVINDETRWERERGTRLNKKRAQKEMLQHEITESNGLQISEKGNRVRDELGASFVKPFLALHNTAKGAAIRDTKLAG